ncbi:hypothetical protein ACHAXS_013044 [Conticribra weissflogii]
MDQGGSRECSEGRPPQHQGQNEQHQEELLFGQQQQPQHGTVYDHQYQQHQVFEQQSQWQQGYGQDGVQNGQQGFRIFQQQQSEHQFHQETNQFHQPLQYEAQNEYLYGQQQQNNQYQNSSQYGYQEQQFSGQFQYEQQERSHHQQYEQYSGYQENMNNDNVTIETAKTGWTGKTGSTGISGLTGASVVGDSGGKRGYISGSNSGSIPIRDAFNMTAVLEEGGESLNEDGEKPNDAASCSVTDTQATSDLHSGGSAKPRAAPLTKRVSQGTTEIANNLTSKYTSDVVDMRSGASNMESNQVLKSLNRRGGGLKSILRSSTTGKSKSGGSTNLRDSNLSIGTTRSGQSGYSGFANQTTQSVQSESSSPYLGTIKSATREINVADIDFLIHADEEVSLPGSYMNYYPNDEDRIIPGKYATSSIVPIPEDEPARSIKLRSSEYVALEYPRMDDPLDFSPFTKKRRNHTFFTAAMAISLAVVGLYMAVVSVSSGYYSDPATTQSSSSFGFGSLLSPGMANGASSGYNYVPGYQFGGGIGGFIGGQERERRIQMGMNQNNFYASNIGEDDYAYVPHPEDVEGANEYSGGENVPTRVSRSFSAEDIKKWGHHVYEYNREDLRNTISDLSRTGMSHVQHQNRVVGSIGSTLSRVANSRTDLVASPKIRNHSEKPEDPFHGYGPPQFNPDYAIAPQGGLSLRTTLSSEPLTSYTPPPSDEESSASLPMLLDPKFHGSFLDLSVLPYNPIREVPVVWDVPHSGSKAAQTIFGNCLKLVLCSREGSHILQSQIDQYQKEVQVEQKHALREKLEMRMLEDHQRLRMQLVVDRPGGDVVYNQNHHDRTSPRDLLQIVEKSQLNENDKDEISEVIEKNPSMELPRSSADFAASTLINFDPPLAVKFAHTSKYVNVDCSTPQGINRGITHHLAASDIMDVVFSPNIYDVARLFAPPTEAYGRAVLLVRHPFERAVAAFDDFKVINKEISAGMTLVDYVESDFFEDNILTRSLSGNFDTPLAKEDIHIAKEVLKRKFIVGLFDRMQESLERFEMFFGWNLDIEAQKCQSTHVQREFSKQINTKIYIDSNENEGVHPSVTPSVLASLAERNRIDLLLFDFVKFLFDYQGRVLFGVLGDNTIHDVRNVHLSRRLDFG